MTKGPTTHPIFGFDNLFIGGVGVNLPNRSKFQQKSLHNRSVDYYLSQTLHNGIKVLLVLHWALSDWRISRSDSYGILPEPFKNSSVLYFGFYSHCVLHFRIALMSLFPSDISNFLAFPSAQCSVHWQRLQKLNSVQL